MDRTDLSLRSIGAIKTEEFSSTSSETQSAGKYNPSMSESNAVRKLEHVSWKYENPTAFLIFLNYQLFIFHEILI